MDSTMHEVSLVTIGGGAAVELFDDALKEALRNIADPNTEAKTPRDIVLKVRIRPSESRDCAERGRVAGPGRPADRESRDAAAGTGYGRIARGVRTRWFGGLRGPGRAEQRRLPIPE
jgi:hypothetical protein